LVAANKAGVPVKLVDTSKAALDKGLAFAGMDELTPTNGWAAASSVIES